jgi:hypothetical protein
LTHFSQRDETIEKQKRSATRDLASALDNNPNLMNCSEQFKFAFMTEDPVQQIEQRIEESTGGPKDLPPKPKKKKPR